MKGNDGGYTVTNSGKGICGAPKSVSDVYDVQNMGWPKGGDPQGHGVAVVLSDGESPLQGEGRQVGNR
jgi:hypothetical protein